MTDEPKVRIEHMRMVRTLVAGQRTPQLVAASTLREWHRASYEFLPCGGATMATITLPDGNEIHGDAVCSETEQFSRKIGRLIATGRALKKYRQHPDVVAGRLADAMDPRR